MPHNNAAGGLVSGDEVVREVYGPSTRDLGGIPVCIADVRGAQLAKDDWRRGDLAASDEINNFEVSGSDKGVNANNFARRGKKRAAAVAGVDGSVSLDHTALKQYIVPDCRNYPTGYSWTTS